MVVYNEQGLDMFSGNRYLRPAADRSANHAVQDISLGWTNCREHTM